MRQFSLDGKATHTEHLQGSVDKKYEVARRIRFELCIADGWIISNGYAITAAFV
jgi:hypothetical protein